jgi:hypothetical protein
MSTLRERAAHLLFPNLMAQPGITEKGHAAAVSVRVDDSAGWDTLQPGPADRPWSERADDLDDALEAWRKNFLVRRIVTLTRSYVVGNGITVSSKLPEVDTFVQAFWSHRQNRMARRLGPICDELTRAGEIFPLLHTNRLDGMSYVRLVPASQIRQIRTADNDYEVEVEYGEIQADTTELKWWNGPGHDYAYRRRRGGPGGTLQPLMLHFAVNRPVGATRGEGDLVPVLPWALRYSEWLKDRVRLNRQRTRQGILDVKIADDAVVEGKRQQLRTSNPIEHGIYVHGPGEEVAMHSLNIRADDAGEDGKLLRLANATGANVALHYLGEGEAVNYATAREMGEPTARFYAERQAELCTMLIELTEAAYRRYVVTSKGGAKAHTMNDLQLVATATEVARADNQSLATATREIVGALDDMKAQGWIDDTTAARMAYKFAGETLGEDDIAAILEQAKSGE